LGSLLLSAVSDAPLFCRRRLKAGLSQPNRYAIELLLILLERTHDEKLEG
jgi:hypothetical protein